MECVTSDPSGPGIRTVNQINHPFLACLAELGQAHLFNAWNFELPIDACDCNGAGDGNRTVRGIRLEIFLCPSDTAPNGRYNYRAVTGSRPSQDPDDPEAWKPNGLYYHGSALKFSDITDGLSYTAMLTERLMRGGMGRRGRTIVLSPSDVFSENDCNNAGESFMEQGVNASGSYDTVTIPFVRTPNSMRPGCLCRSRASTLYRAFDGPSATSEWC